MHSARKTAGWLLLPLIAASSPAAAQVQGMYRPVAPPPVQGQPAAGSAASELSRNLNILASNPYDVRALTGAGKAALELGDAEAALTFFARAEERSPQDGMIKAGLGSALALMEQPETALQFFYEAIRRGVPASEIAANRGLAYDLVGDPQHAQQDYQLALRRREDPEVRRRLALSMAISGQRDTALAVIDPQLRRQDRAAWRVRAFILALTGDAQGATRVVESVMPHQAAAMAPFLARLPSLSLADRARAVHFGHFPGEPSAAAATATAMGGPAPPGMDTATSAGQPDPAQRPLGASALSAPTPPTAQASGPAISAAPRASQTTSQAGPSAGIGPVIAPSPDLASQAPSDAAPLKVAPVGSSSPNQSAPSTRNLSDVATLIARLTDPPAAAKAAPAKPTPARKAETPAQKEPSRRWVQIARAPDEAKLGGEYRRLKAKAPKVFAGKTAWSTEWGDSNRLLVGPFKSNKEAQDFVNQLAEEDLGGFSWTSAAGQEIKKLPAK